MFQQEYYPYGFSLIETSLSNVAVLSSNGVISSSSSSARLSCSIVERQSHSTETLSSPRARGGSGEEPPWKRRRRRGTRCEQKIEEKENQRMDHIFVERNRRRQMNHFLSILKSMMPLSYSQRSDQASIIEGTINYLKKQEQLLQSLEAKLKTTKPNQSPNIFSDFFIFPQYSTANAASFSSHHHHEGLVAVADVEVTMIMGKHANIKVLTKPRPRLLFKMINEFYSLGLSTLHLNLTTSKDMSLFTFTVKLTELQMRCMKSLEEFTRKI